VARNFRFYEKKRGHRRTGSRLVGSAGEAIFFAAFLVLGCTWLVRGFVSFVIPEWRVNHEFVEHTCIVLEKHLGETADSRGGKAYRPEIKIEYLINGETYRSDWMYDIHMDYSGSREKCAAVLERYVEGRHYTCWYDPANPRVVVLRRGYSGWNWLVFLVPASFVVIGGGGLLYSVLRWGKSAERCAATMPRSPRELLAGNAHGGAVLPAVPDWSDITSSPGTRLAFRLPMANSPAWAVFGLLLACLLWNGVVAGLAVLAIRGHLEGRPDWLLTLFVVPFLLVGLGLIALLVRQLLRATGIGPTLVEISGHPLLPGGQYQVFVSQSSSFKINALELALLCEEEATYRQGTNTRTEIRPVYSRQVFRRQGAEREHGGPFQVECSLQVPAAAMHSFKADHNAINWKLVVQGDVAGWPGFQRSFPVVVRPLGGPAREQQP
jgi:hypothetical protein